MYKIVASYKGSWEVIDQAHTLKDAKEIKDGYLKSRGDDWEVAFYKYE